MECLERKGGRGEYASLIYNRSYPKFRFNLSVNQPNLGRQKPMHLATRKHSPFSHNTPSNQQQRTSQPPEAHKSTPPPSPVFSHLSVFMNDAPTYLALERVLDVGHGAID